MSVQFISLLACRCGRWCSKKDFDLQRPPNSDDTSDEEMWDERNSTFSKEVRALLGAWVSIGTGAEFANYISSTVLNKTE